jgi:hypothetical protein
MDIEFTNLLEVESISTSTHCRPGLKLIDTKGHQYENETWPRDDDLYFDKNGEIIFYWSINDGATRFVYPLVDGEIWGGVSTRGWILWPKIKDDAEIKRIILTLDASPDETGKSPFKDMPGMRTVTHVAINVHY